MLKSQLVTTLLTQPQLFCVKKGECKSDLKKISALGELAFTVIHYIQ